MSSPMKCSITTWSNCGHHRLQMTPSCGSAARTQRIGTARLPVAAEARGVAQEVPLRGGWATLTCVTVDVRVGEPPPRAGRVFGGAEEHVIPDNAMALSWKGDAPIWYVINNRLGTMIDEYEEDTLTADQAIAAADILRELLAAATEPAASRLRSVADFLEWHGGAGHEVIFVL